MYRMGDVRYGFDVVSNNLELFTNFRDKFILYIYAEPDLGKINPGYIPRVYRSNFKLYEINIHF